MSATRDRPLRVALYGEFGTGNLGNDASLLAAMTALRSYHPDVRLLCLCNAPELVAERYGINARAIRRHSVKDGSRLRGRPVRVLRRVTRLLRLCSTDLWRMYRIMREVDVVIVPGMGVLEAGRMKADSFAAPLFMAMVAARLARARSALVSVGAEGAYRRSTRTLLRGTLKLVAYRSFRDFYSRSHAMGFGVRCGTDPVVPDLVFGLQVPHGTATPEMSGSVGVGLINYRAALFANEPAHRDAIAANYVKSLTSFVDWLLTQGLKVTLLTGDRKDENVALAVYEGASGHQLSNSLDFVRCESLEQLLIYMRRMDYVIGSRYHNIVAAVLNAKPVISISYKRKNSELMKGLGFSRFHQPLESLDDQLLREQFIELQRSARELSEQMVDKCDEYRKRVQEQWLVLNTTVLAPHPTNMPTAVARIERHRRNGGA